MTVPVLVLATSWLFTPRRTNRRLVRAGPLRRSFRWYRSIWTCAVALMRSWPHVVDVFFRTHRTPVAQSPVDLVWQEGRTQLFRLRGPRDERVPVLVVHSLISRPWILDLTPERSLVGALRDAGFDVFVLDWGEFGRAESQHDLSHYAEILMRAEKQVLSSAGADRLQLVGYCLGATLCLARVAARRHDQVSSLVMLAPPVDFAVPSPLHSMMTHPALKPAYLLDASSCVPAPVVRESFHLLRPQALRTVRSRIRNRRDPEFRRTYDALARWVWEHRRLPGGVFFDLVDLFRTNALYEGRMEIAGELARLSDIKTRVAIFVAQRDHIVPTGSAHAAGSIPGLDATIIDCPSGHVSMICGSGARDVTWPNLVNWLSAQPFSANSVTGERAPG